MVGLDELIDQEYGDDQSRLYFQLADEDQQLLGALVAIRRATMTQAAIAQGMGVTQATVSAFERLGNDPRMSTVRRYARALGVMVRHDWDERPQDCGESEFLIHMTSDGPRSEHSTAAAVTRRLSGMVGPAGRAWPDEGADAGAVVDALKAAPRRALVGKS